MAAALQPARSGRLQFRAHQTIGQMPMRPRMRIDAHVHQATLTLTAHANRVTQNAVSRVIYGV